MYLLKIKKFIKNIKVNDDDDSGGLNLKT